MRSHLGTLPPAPSGRTTLLGAPSGSQLASSEAKPSNSIDAGHTLPVPHAQLTARHTYPLTTEYSIACEHAVRVNVRANMIEVLAVDGMDEYFTALFSLTLFWIDPWLSGFKSEVAYLLSDGSPRKRRAKLVHRPGLDGHTDFGLEVDPRQDFALGDSVEAVTYLSCQDQTIQCGARGRITGIRHKQGSLIVSWHSDLVGEHAQSEVVIVLAEGSEKAGDFLLVRLPPTRFVGIQQPCWNDDPFLFRPEWSFMNAIDDPVKHVHTKQLEYISEVGGHVSEKFKFQGKFSRKLHLGFFPFDNQQLGIKITSEQPLYRQQFASLDAVAGKLVSVPSEWKQGSEGRLQVHLPKQSRYQQVRVIVQLDRKPSFFLKHVVFLMFFLCCASCLASLVSPAKVAERSAILLTVLLVMAGYQHMISQWVPRKSYHTCLGIYTLIAFFFQFVVLLELMVISLPSICKPVADVDDISASPPPTKECLKQIAKLDVLFYTIVFGGWVTAHALFAICYTARIAWSACCSKACRTKNSLTQSAQVMHPYGFVATGDRTVI